MPFQQLSSGETKRTSLEGTPSISASVIGLGSVAIVGLRGESVSGGSVSGDPVSGDPVWCIANRARSDARAGRVRIGETNNGIVVMSSA
ncbi:hypothetical protein V500_09203 [Pseudogymnoascus sp. VKM F-4518 (FW-2643)]|nr:hypothetical protein V500_09203 [Pseudogymnoascus sp. VKM F-4518 (FW-2643)]KFZ16173.1 hypothetical protein V502_05230 [Pseudogymnoascus sp. VKM F-4520 (FW-2644)]